MEYDSNFLVAAIAAVSGVWLAIDQWRRLGKAVKASEEHSFKVTEKKCAGCGSSRVGRFCTRCGLPTTLAIRSDAFGPPPQKTKARGAEFDPSTVYVSPSGQIQPIWSKPMVTPPHPPKEGAFRPIITPAPPPKIGGENQRPVGARPNPPPLPPAPKNVRFWHPGL